MSFSVPSPTEHRLPDGDRGRHGLIRAWIAATSMLAIVATSTIVMNSLDVETGFTIGWLLLATLVLVQVALASIAVRSGQRASRSGHPSGLIPVVIGTMIAAFGVFLAVVTLVGRAIGFE